MTEKNFIQDYSRDNDDFRKKGDLDLKLKWAMAILLCIQFCCLVVSNLILIERNIDCDTGKMFSHIMEMYKRKTICIPDWTYPSTLEWDCTTIFALPLYGITGNIYLACGISNVLIYILWVMSIFFLFKGKHSKYPLFALNLITVPYTVGMLDYYNMLFFGGAQYSIKVILPIMLVGIILQFEAYKELNKIHKKGLYVFSGIFCFLLLLTSMSSGIYVAACGIFPIVAVYVLYKLFSWEHIPMQQICIGIGIIICIFIGLIINMRVMGGARGQSMVFGSVYIALANVSSCFIGMFELMGGVTTAMDMSVISKQGITILLKLFMTLIFLGSGLYAAGKWRKKRSLRVLLLLAIPVWNYFVLNIINTRAGSPTYEYRYHLIGMIPLICVSAGVLLDGMEKCNKGQKQCLIIGGLMTLVLVNFVSNYALFIGEEKNQDLKELTEYCSNLNVDIVYLYDGSNDSDICRTLDNSVPYICLLDERKTWVYDYYEKYVDAPMQTENMIIAVNREKYDWGENYNYYGLELVQFDIVGNRSLYKIK